MTYSVYILYSASLNRYYIGKTSLSIKDRLQYHLFKHKGFTSKASDWQIIFSIEVSSNQEAKLLERKIKKRGAGRFLEDLDAAR